MGDRRARGSTGRGSARRQAVRRACAPAVHSARAVGEVGLSCATQDDPFAALGGSHRGPVAQGKHREVLTLWPVLFCDRVAQARLREATARSDPDDLARGVCLSAGACRKLADGKHAAVRDARLVGAAAAARTTHQGLPVGRGLSLLLTA